MMSSQTSASPRVEEWVAKTQQQVEMLDLAATNGPDDVVTADDISDAKARDDSCEERSVSEERDEPGEPVCNQANIDS